MAPIGIITIITSAIRVGGPRWLKAIIGRARENTAAAEAELMSSTSRETCELWNGDSVVRCHGSGRVWQFICLVPDKRKHGDEPYDVECMSLEEATEEHAGNGSPKNSRIYLRKADIKASSKLKHWLTKWLSVQLWPPLSFLKRCCGARRPLAADQEAGICMSSGVLDAQAPMASTSEVRDPHDAILQGRSFTSLLDHENFSDRVAPDEILQDRSSTSLSGQEGFADCVPNVQPGPEPTQKDRVIVIRELSKIAPNLALNCHDRPHRREIILVAIGGVMLQVGVLIWSGFSIRKPLAEELKKNDKNVKEYALLLTATGTVLLTLGLLICGWVVEHSTKEMFYEAVEGYSIHLIWLQKGGAVNDQDFKPFAIFPIQNRSYLTISRRNNDVDVHEHDNKSNPDDDTDHATGDAASDLNMQWWTISGCFIALIGFFSQFTGLRGMNYSVSIAQFLAMAIMTCARAFIRRGLVASPSSEMLPQDFELDWFVKSFENPNPSWMNKQTWLSLQRERKLSSGRGGTSRHNTKDTQEPEICDKYAQHILDIRLRLAKLSDWRGPASNEAILLADAVEAVASELLPQSLERFAGKFQVVLKGKTCLFLLNLERVQGSWRARADEFEAVLSLWLSTFVEEEGALKVNSVNDKDSWLRIQRARETGLRILGRAPEAYALLRDLRLWLPEDVEEILEIEDGANTDAISQYEKFIDVANHRVVGDDASRVVNKAEIRTRFRIRRAIDMKIVNFDKGGLAFECLKPSPKIDRIRKRFARENSCKGDIDWRTCEMENTKLSKVAQKLANTGFLTLAEAYLDIVAPLSIAQDLPGPSILFRHLKHKLNESFSKSSYDRFETALMSLLELAVTYETPRRTLAPQALAICHYYFELLTYAFNVDIREQRLDAFMYDYVRRLEDVVRKMLYPEWEGFLPGPWSVFADQFSIWRIQTECPTMPERVRIEEADAERFQLSKQHISAILPFSHGRSHETESEFVEKTTSDVFQWTSVHYYAAIGVRDPFREAYLLDGPKARLNFIDIFGLSPLHYACLRGRTSAVEFLQVHDALVDVEQENGISPMHLAAASGNTEVVELLLKALKQRKTKQRLEVRSKKKIPTAKDFNGRVPIHWATMKGHIGIVKLLSVDMNVTDKFGLSCLHLAVLYQHRELVQWLVGQPGCNVDALHETLHSPLHLALLQLDEEIAMTIAEKTLDVNLRNGLGKTPLHLAVQRGNFEMVQLLLKRGAHIDITDDTGQAYIPLHYAIQKQNLEIFNSLLEDVEASQRLKRLSARRAVLIKCSSGFNALFCVARIPIENEKEFETAGAMARAIIDLMDPEDVNMQVDGYTALHWACFVASTPVVAALLNGEAKGRASIKMKDEEGRTPLDLLRERFPESNGDLQKSKAGRQQTEDVDYDAGPITYNPKQDTLRIQRMLEGHENLQR